MTLNELLKEYNLEIDDIRWSLSKKISFSISEHIKKDNPDYLTGIIWSGELCDQLYDIEERWMRETSENFERGLLDEGHLRDELSEIRADKISRRQTQS